jgi:hypothetical protein
MVAATIRERLLTEGAAAWNKHLSVWRVAEDDPDSGLYDESGDVET